MFKLYAFELGRQKDLSLAELSAVLGKDNLVEKNLDTAVFKLQLDNPQKLQDQLGGTIKIIEILDTLPAKSNLNKPVKEILTAIFKDQEGGKVPFSISKLSYPNPHELDIKDLLIFSKKILKSFNLNSRFVNKEIKGRFRSPKPSTIYKAKIVQKGIDINIIKGKNNQIHIGRTVSIQNIDAYTARDYKKPYRDAKVGMTPPKLAQIMLNLATSLSKTPPETVFDPFCGTGTFLIEALLQDHHAIGSDISGRMSEYATKNCQWYIKQKNLQSPQPTIFTKDARFLTPKDLPAKPDLIVTEGYLGKPQSKLPDKQEQEVIFRELSNLHLNWLRAARTYSKCPIVMCATAFQKPTKSRREKPSPPIRFPNFEQIAKEAGYRIESRHLYARPDQVVAREIISLIPA